MARPRPPRSPRVQIDPGDRVAGIRDVRQRSLTIAAPAAPAPQEVNRCRSISATTLTTSAASWALSTTTATVSRRRCLSARRGRAERYLDGIGRLVDEDDAQCERAPGSRPAMFRPVREAAHSFRRKRRAGQPPAERTEPDDVREQQWPRSPEQLVSPRRGGRDGTHRTSPIRIHRSSPSRPWPANVTRIVSTAVMGPLQRRNVRPRPAAYRPWRARSRTPARFGSSSSELTVDTAGCRSRTRWSAAQQKS